MIVKNKKIVIKYNKVGFQIEMNSYLFALDIIYIFHNFLHFFIEMKTAQYFNGILTGNFLFLFKNYVKNDFFLDILGILPFNLIFG